ncbi:MAG TPA: protein-methionine-sulfoxide reductase heme-binding subunit MsrQ [Hyphomicrobium sp.]|nr:protein-methionine-sulfoxide reductase heme-binding subunit MsrQ [Hyphomicrobium sp.]HRO49385.1 protein-methionine-sulfoxide reductase heme-binding subunit MsrQ [Hyphomicrobium sp.]
MGGSPAADGLQSPPPNLPRKRGGVRPSWIGPGGWALYALGLSPGAWTFYLGLTDQLGADPLKVLERTLGLWALRFLVIGLAITPLRKIGGPNLIRYRRTIGLLAFFYALAHVVVYVVLDRGLDLAAILADIVKRPYITVGMVAFLVLVPLAVTSNATMIRRLGAAAWQRLHRWVYLAAAAGALHFIMLLKTVTFEAAFYAAMVAVLLAFRLWNRGRLSQPRR